MNVFFWVKDKVYQIDISLDALLKMDKMFTAFFR